jgi:hypothetical protein
MRTPAEPTPEIPGRKRDASDPLVQTLDAQQRGAATG